MPDAITRLVRSCEPNESLLPSDPRYVNCDDVRGENLIQVYARSFMRASPDKPDIKLFAGHRGVGKTSELLRLKRILETDSVTPFRVIYFDVGKTLDPNDLEFPDLLVFTAAEVQRQLEDVTIQGVHGVSGYFTRVWDDITSILSSKVSLTSAEVPTPYANIALEIKNRPSARSQLRQAIEEQSTHLLGAVNDCLKAATDAVIQSGHAGLVLIIDGLDKVVLRTVDDGQSNTHVRLFCDRAEQLTSIQAHTLYTVPISLIYSPRCAQLEQCFGEFSVPIPMIRLRGENKSPVSPETSGMQKMREIILARCRFAGVDINEVFDDPSTADFLCEMTGGHPRHLMMFLQAAANAVDAFPITRKASENAVRNYANSLLREIPDAYWERLRMFDQPRDDIPKDTVHQEMLFLLHVFEYTNDRPWYEVNPVLRTLPKFRNE